MTDALGGLMIYVCNGVYTQLLERFLVYSCILGISIETSDSQTLNLSQRLTCDRFLFEQRSLSGKGSCVLDPQA